MKPNDDPKRTAEGPRPEEQAPDRLRNEHADEHHSHGNYIFALKVLAILVAIICVILILQALGVPFALKDWLPWH